MRRQGRDGKTSRWGSGKKRLERKENVERRKREKKQRTRKLA